MSSLTYARWARELRMSEWGLRRAHGTLLRLMVDYVDAGGRVEVGVKTLAATLDVTREYVHKLQRELHQVGLLRKVRGGAGRRAAVWQCRLDALPPTQMTLDLAAETVNSATVNSDCDRELLTVDSVNSGVHKKEGKGVKGEDAHELFTVSDAPRESPGPAVLAPTLDVVLAVLSAAPGVDVEPLSINAILLGHPEPEHDHHRGAQTVAAWAHEGGLWARSGSRLLQRALLKQTEHGARQANAIPPVARRQGTARKPWDGALAAARAQQAGGVA